MTNPVWLRMLIKSKCFSVKFYIGYIFQVDVANNAICRLITICLGRKVYTLSSLPLPDIRAGLASQKNIRRASTSKLHPLPVTVLSRGEVLWSQLNCWLKQPSNPECNCGWYQITTSFTERRFLKIFHLVTEKPGQHGYI